MELLTYYIAKSYYVADYNLKDKIYNWLCDFFHDNEDEIICTDYFCQLIEGNEICPTDEYYLNYDDFDKVISAFKQ